MASQSSSVHNRIFVGGIGNTHVQEQHLREAFSRFGTITAVMMKDQGFAFIEFDNPESVQASISQMHQQEVSGVRINVEQAKGPKHMWSEGVPRPGAPRNAAVRYPWRLRVFDLPLGYRWQQVKDLCREFGEVNFASAREDGSGRSEALVEFREKEPFLAAMRGLAGRDVEGNAIRTAATAEARRVMESPDGVDLGGDAVGPMSHRDDSRPHHDAGYHPGGGGGGYERGGAYDRGAPEMAPEYERGGGPPPGYERGPPPGYERGPGGPPPGYERGPGGPPPGYERGGPPPGYERGGPPPGYERGPGGPPPGYERGPGGPPPGSYGRGGPGGPPPGYDHREGGYGAGPGPMPGADYPHAAAHSHHPDLHDPEHMQPGGNGAAPPPPPSGRYGPGPGAGPYAAGAPVPYGTSGPPGPAASYAGPYGGYPGSREAEPSEAYRHGGGSGGSGSGGGSGGPPMRMPPPTDGYYDAPPGPGPYGRGPPGPSGPPPGRGGPPPPSGGPPVPYGGGGFDGRGPAPSGPEYSYEEAAYAGRPPHYADAGPRGGGLPPPPGPGYGMARGPPPGYYEDPAAGGAYGPPGRHGGPPVGRPMPPQGGPGPAYPAGPGGRGSDRDYVRDDDRRYGGPGPGGVPPGR